MAKKKADAEVKPQVNEEQQKMLIKHTNMVNVLVTETYLRHNKLDTAEYLKAIGFGETKKTEQEAVAIATFNLLIEWTKTMFEARRRLDMANKMLKEFMEIKDEEKENE